jgi:hypothetical protein
MMNRRILGSFGSLTGHDGVGRARQGTVCWETK